MLAVVDEYTRECLPLEVERSITPKGVVKTLASLFDQRGEPSFIRSDRRRLSSVSCSSDAGVDRAAGARDLRLLDKLAIGVRLYTKPTIEEES
jgi:hypothetical protein